MADSHEGHRARMRKRYLEAGIDGLLDHEVIELLLTYAMPRVDTKPAAHALLDRFGSLSNVFDADITELIQINGIGENAAVFLNMLVPVFNRYRQDASKEKVKLSSPESVKQYCVNFFRGKKEEAFYILSFDAKLRLIGSDLVSEGIPTQVVVHIRHVVSKALSRKAVGAIITHNHPAGSLTPSREDIELTKKIRDALSNLDISLFDHIICAGEDAISFREEGYEGVGSK